MAAKRLFFIFVLFGWCLEMELKWSTIYLGAYDDEEAAAHAYNLAASKYWGQDTILNFPGDMADWQLSKSAFQEKKTDVHTRLMNKYNQVPEESG